MQCKYYLYMCAVDKDKTRHCSRRVNFVSNPYIVATLISEHKVKSDLNTSLEANIDRHLVSDSQLLMLDGVTRHQH